MPVIGGNTPTVTVQVPVPSPAPMKKPRPAPQPVAPQPVPTNPESDQQDTPQGMVPPVPQQPEPRAIILPYAPPPSGRSAMRKMRVKMARATPESISSLFYALRLNPRDETTKHALADELQDLGTYTPKEINTLRTVPYLNFQHVPANPQRPVHFSKLSLTDIRNANQASGSHWFDRASMRFFGTKIHGAPKHGPGGVFFVSSEQPPSRMHGASRRVFSVRRFDPETSAIHTVGSLGQHGDVTSAMSEAIGRADNHPRFQEQPEQLSRPKKYAADDGLSMDFDSMGEDELPKAPLQRPAPKEDVTGRTRKQILQQMLEAAKKGFHSDMSPREMIQDIETPPDIPQGGGDVWLSDDEDLK